MKRSLLSSLLVASAVLVGCSGDDARVPKRLVGGTPGSGGESGEVPGSATGSTPATPAPVAPPAPPPVDGPWPGSGVVFLPFPAQRARSNPAWGAMLTDLAQHVPPMYGAQYDEPGDPIAWGEIATIGIGGYLRGYENPYASSGKNANGFYVTKDRMAFVLEPGLTLTKVLSYLPSGIRGPLYGNYMAGAVGDWDATPSYVLDEWITFTNGSEVAVELGAAGKWTSPRPDAIRDTLEFTIYGLALAAATEANDPTYYAAEPQLRELVAWNAERALGLYRAGSALPVFASPDNDALYAAWTTSEDGIPLRNFARRAFGAKYVTKVLGIGATPE